MNIRVDDFIFPSPEDRKSHISGEALNEYLRKLGYKVLGRGIFPYLIRHTRLTQIHKLLPTQVACKFAGHSPAVAKLYTHLSNDDVREAMLENIYHVEEISEKDNNIIKKLEEELDALKNNNKSHKISLSKFKSENREIWKWLKRATKMNKVLLKALMKNKKIESAIKLEIKKIFADGKPSFSMHETA
jgi:hypothetical protein